MSLQDRLVEDWRSALKWWSVRLAIAGGLVSGFVFDPGNLLTAVQLLYAMPPEYRWFISPLIGFAVALIPIAARLWKQGSKADG